MEDTRPGGTLVFPVGTRGRPPELADHDDRAAPRTIVIVGAGFSGTLVAVNLLRLSRQPLRITLIERGDIARGVAYARRDYPHLLNVAAGRMSASSADPMEFLAYARRSLPHADAQDFLPRELYGDYLGALLAKAELMAPPHTRLERLQGSAAIAIARLHRGSQLEVHLENTRRVRADQVVLALGNPPPGPLAGAESLQDSPRFLADPWARPVQARAGETLLIVGSGLTMVDIALAAQRASAGGVIIHAISRHGLLPAPQAAPGHSPDEEQSRALLESIAPCTRHLLRSVRALAEDATRHGGDWRDIIGAVRTLAPCLWEQLPAPERQRFLRHVRSYWDIHRHRLPHSTWSAIDSLRRAGRLHIHAGRISELRAAGKRIAVTWRARGTRHAQSLLVERVINCSGADFNLRRTRERVLRSLLAQGIAIADPLGVVTDAHGALVDARSGRASRNLYYVGPLLRARYWETTAVPELRGHAERLAQHLLAQQSDAPYSTQPHELTLRYRRA